VDVDKLKATIGRLTGSTAAARLRQVMPEIDQKVTEGVRHEQILAALREEGIDVSLETFRKNLYRYRAKLRAAAGAPAASGVQDAASEPAAAAVSFEEALDPRKRDEIAESYLNRRKPLIGAKRRSQ
jgi:hypothetical protein